jgi:hypothetical protein
MTAGLGPLPGAPGDLLPYLIAELKAVRADLKNCARDTVGLMYEHGPDGLRLRDFVAGADTNGPPEDADARIWAARGRLGDLLDLLEPIVQERAGLPAAPTGEKE